MVGYGLVLVSGSLGGSLVSRHRVGVDHADRRLEPRRFTIAFPDAELHERQPVRVRVAGVSVLLVRYGGRIYAVGEECSHLGGPLAHGWGDTGVCPWHGSSYVPPRWYGGAVAAIPSARCRPSTSARPAPPS
jgi:Rieske Fe-S protein